MCSIHILFEFYSLLKNKKENTAKKVSPCLQNFALRVKVKLFRTTMELNHLLIISQDTRDYSLYGPPNKQAGKNRTVFHLYNSNGIGGLDKMKEFTF